MARPLRKSAGVRGDNHRHVRIGVETAVIRPATENVRPRLVKGDPEPPWPVLGNGRGASQRRPRRVRARSCVLPHLHVRGIEGDIAFAPVDEPRQVKPHNFSDGYARRRSQLPPAQPTRAVRRQIAPSPDSRHAVVFDLHHHRNGLADHRAQYLFPLDCEDRWNVAACGCAARASTESTRLGGDYDIVTM